MRTNHTKCLLLNADYTPICLVTWMRAITWYYRYERYSKNGIDIIDFYKDDSIKGVNKNFPIPAVARTNKFFKIYTTDQVVFSRKNIFIRDNYQCQYCGKEFEHKELTYDHVIPKSKWPDNTSPTNWTNIVTACKPCNSKKGDRNPKQANMPLLKSPTKPEKRLRYLPIFEYLSTINTVPEEWKLYLPEY